MTGRWSIPVERRGGIIQVGYCWDPDAEVLYRRVLDTSDMTWMVEWAALPASVPDEEEIAPAAWDEPAWLADCLWHVERGVS